jgi:RND family efflux transporter MFP subunit
MGALLLMLPVLARAQAMPPLDCIVEPEMVIELSSSVDGVVRDVLVDRSDPVSAGQVLATLESRVEEAEVDLAETRAGLEEEIEAARIQNDLAQSKKERLLELFSKKSIPGFEKDEAIATAALAELALKRAYSNQKLAQLELERARADLALRSITSPIDGVVMDRYVHPGESVKDQPLLKLAKINPMRVEIIAYSEYFGRVEPGMQAQVVIEGPVESRQMAAVTLVDSVVDAASGTFGIRLALPNPDDAVIGGLKCRAEFPSVK